MLCSLETVWRNYEKVFCLELNAIFNKVIKVSFNILLPSDLYGDGVN